MLFVLFRRTNTRNGDGLCQAFYGTEDATYELNKAAATLAKQARGSLFMKQDMSILRIMINSDELLYGLLL